MTNSASSVTLTIWDIDYTYEPNVAVFQTALDRLTDHPEVWAQGRWVGLYKESCVRSISELAKHTAPACGTVGCLAGNIALMSGAKTIEWGGSISDTRVQTIEGRVREVSDHAMIVLGVPSEVINHYGLFAGRNSLAKLWELGQLMTGNRLNVPKAKKIRKAQELSSHLYG